jgi:hypothetical protein
LGKIAGGTQCPDCLCGTSSIGKGTINNPEDLAAGTFNRTVGPRDTWAKLAGTS